MVWEGSGIEGGSIWRGQRVRFDPFIIKTRVRDLWWWAGCLSGLGGLFLWIRLWNWIWFLLGVNNLKGSVWFIWKKNTTRTTFVNYEM